jgi:hypothetical protein
MSTACFAGRIAPLALMFRPLQIFALSPTRADTRADFSSGFRALSVGSHHLVVTLDPNRLWAKSSSDSPFVYAATGRSS